MSAVQLLKTKRMEKAQRDFLRQRLSSVHSYTRSRGSRIPPAAVRAAQKVIARWEASESKRAARYNERMRKAYRNVSEQIHGNDYELALACVKAFEATFPAE